MLTSKQKSRLAGVAETAWLWLSDQRAGRFTTLVRSTRVQRGFALFAHLSMLCLMLAFLARVFFGIRINVGLEIGHPRLYLFQVWVDVAALLVSACLVAWWAHPKVALWIGSAPSLPRYYGRAAKAYAFGWLAMLALLVVQLPIMMSFFQSDTAADIRVAYERSLAYRGLSLLTR